jgi:hypothetical protein
MPDAPPTDWSLSGRLERLERQNRALRYALAAVGLVALVALAGVLEQEAKPAGHGPPASDTVAAKRFVLQDDAGRQYAALRLEEVTYQKEGQPAERRQRPILEFYGENALLPRLQLSSDRHGSRLSLMSPKAGCLVALGAEDEMATILLSDSLAEQGPRRQVALVAGKEGAGLGVYQAVGPFHAQPRERFEAFLTKDGPKLAIYGGNGEVLFAKP